MEEEGKIQSKTRSYWNRSSGRRKRWQRDHAKQCLFRSMLS